MTLPTAVRRTVTALLSTALVAAGGVALATSASAAIPRCFTATYVTTGGSRIYAPAAPWNDSGLGDWACFLSQQANVQNQAIVALQVSINHCYIRLGRTPGPYLDEDGIFGAKTTAALKKVQEFERISNDGIYGLNTRNTMFWKYETGSCKDGWY